MSRWSWIVYKFGYGVKIISNGRKCRKDFCFCDCFGQKIGSGITHGNCLFLRHNWHNYLSAMFENCRKQRTPFGKFDKILSKHKEFFFCTKGHLVHPAVCVLTTKIFDTYHLAGLYISGVWKLIIVENDIFRTKFRNAPKMGYTNAFEPAISRIGCPEF